MTWIVFTFKIVFMELNTEKIRALKNSMKLTWDDISRLGNLNSRQSAYDKYKHGSIKSAEFFGKIFNIDPKELIK